MIHFVWSLRLSVSLFYRKSRIYFKRVNGFEQNFQGLLGWSAVTLGWPNFWVMRGDPEWGNFFENLAFFYKTYPSRRGGEREGRGDVAECDVVVGCVLFGMHFSQ